MRIEVGTDLTRVICWELTSFSNVINTSCNQNNFKHNINIKTQKELLNNN